MIVMFMGDQNSVDSVGIFSNAFEALRDFLAADTCINEKSNRLGLDKRGIPAASAAEHRHSHSHDAHYGSVGGQLRALELNIEHSTLNSEH